MHHGNKFCHLSHDNEQQQHQAAAAAGAQVHAGIYEYLLVRRAAACGITIIYQVKVLCCQTVRGVYVTTTVIPHSSSTMYAHITDFSIAQTTPQSSLNFFHWNKKTGNVTENRKKIILDFNHGQPGQGNSNLPLHLLRFVHDNLSCSHKFICTRYE